MLQTIRRAEGFRIAVFVALLFAFVLLPFFALEQLGWEVSARLLNNPHTAYGVFSLVVVGLALDVFLPLPSTIIAATGAALLGGTLGYTAVWLGLSLGCILGYEFGATAGKITLQKMVSPGQRKRLRWLESRLGLGALALCRAIPVLAEVSVLMAGSAGLSRLLFYPLCAVANLVVSALYIVLTEPLITTAASSLSP